MNSKELTIKVFDDIHDVDLKKAWVKLQYENDVFPQMHYEWMEPWVRLRFGKRKLHIVAVLEKDEIIAIAPFCIENKIGLKILHTIPIHFGDFYSIISNESKEIIEVILEYLKSCINWSVVHFFNVNNKNTLSACLSNNKDFKEKKVVDIHEANFDGLSFQEYLLTLSKNTRGQYRNKWNRLSKKGDVKLEAITSSESYELNTAEMNKIYNLRWKNDNIPLLTQAYYNMRNEAIKPYFDKKSAILYRLSLNDEAIAYRLGFLHNKTFFEWKVIYNPEYSYYSPGNLLVGKIIEDILPKGFNRFNFMTGDYRYKKSWVSEKNTSTNYEYLYARKLSFGQYYVTYRLKYRESIKKAFYILKESKGNLLRKLK